jgi:hypothetical protein
MHGLQRHLRHSALGAGSALLLLALAGCATSYRPKGFFGDGFSEEKLAPDLWLVTFDASSFTPVERVKNYLLLRCAELTLEQGRAYFIVVMAEGNNRRAGATVPTLIDEPPFPLGQAQEPEPPPSRSARAAIHLYKEKPEEKSYDARALIRELSGERKS